MQNLGKTRGYSLNKESLQHIPEFIPKLPSCSNNAWWARSSPKRGVPDLRDEKMKVKAILFDLDGTILDIADRDAFARYKALNQLGHRVSLNEVERHYRYGIGPIAMAKELGIEFNEKEEEEYIEASFAHFTKKENAMRLTKIHNRAYNVLSILSKKCKIVLATSRDALSSTGEELEWFNIRKFFTLIITREVAAKYHGVRDIPLLPFHEQRTKLYECAIGLTKTGPRDILCIGDSVAELEPAKKLGMKTIGVLTGYSSKEDMENAAIPTIQDLAQLVKILDCSNSTPSPKKYGEFAGGPSPHSPRALLG